MVGPYITGIVMMVWWAWSLVFTILVTIKLFQIAKIFKKID